jgi:hypothetical protein
MTDPYRFLLACVDSNPMSKLASITHSPCHSRTHLEQSELDSTMELHATFFNFLPNRAISAPDDWQPRYNQVYSVTRSRFLVRNVRHNSRDVALVTCKSY